MPTRIGRGTLSFRNPYGSDDDIVKTDKVTNGSSVRDWRARMKRGEDCSTSYTRTETFIEEKQRGSWESRWKWRAHSEAPWKEFTGSATGSPSLGSTVSFQVPTNADNAAKAAFLHKMDATRKSLSSVTVLGELGQVIKQIRHPFASIQKAISSHISLVEKRGLREYKFLKRRPRARKRAARDFAQGELKDDVAIRNLALRKAATGSYLELVFGIQPTLSDVRAGIEASHRLGERAVDMQRISAGSKFEVNIPRATLITDGLFNLAGPGPFGPTQSAHVKISGTVKVEGKIRYSGAIALHMNRTSPFKEEFGFMPRDFIPGVWNFLPWSWLVDYAFDVGTCLEALTASYSDLKWVNKAITWNHRQIFESEGDPIMDVSDSFNQKGLGTRTISPSRVVIRTMSYSRTPAEANMSTFMPEFSLKMPSMVQMLNLAAVVHQQVGVSKRFHAKRSGPEFSRLDDLHLIR